MKKNKLLNEIREQISPEIRDKVINSVTLETNKLIAEFMGMEHCYRPYGNGFMEVKECGSVIELDDLEYHTSWDWLMPVVEKVNKVSGYDDYNTHRLHIQRVFADCVFENAVSKKEVHKAVVEFIKWYNENKNQKR